MKKNLIVLAILSVTVLSLGVAGYAYAHSQTPPVPGDAYAPRTMGGYGGYGMMGDHAPGIMDGIGDEGPMHETMIAAFAEALRLTPEELEARHDAGETLWQIAESQGLNEDDIQSLMLTAQDKALNQAVADGTMTQEQANWMIDHMNQMWEGGFTHCNGSGANSPYFQGQDMGWNTRP